ncbi:MAG: amidohydrolase family protein [Clostridia bacterium]|nr:amidohydrolase family protein [Clostridia bacterium]
MIVDFHVHCFPDNVADKAIPVLAERAGIPARLTGKLEDIKKSMERSKIDCSVVLSIATNPEQTEKINTWASNVNGGGIVSFGSIHPDYKEWKYELRRISELGLKGIKFHPDYQSFYVDEDRMFCIYEYALGLGLVLVFHAGIDIGLPLPCHCTPDRLLRVVDAFPEGKIVAAHMGGYSCWDDVERYLVGENLYLDTSYSIGQTDDEQIKRIIRNHNQERILFATDSPWCDQNEEIGKIKELKLGEELENMILGGNAKALLGI